MAGARYTKVIKLVREAEDLARSGALVLDDGGAAIYFLWGQPSHAYMQMPDGRVEGEAALKEIALALASPGKVTWRSKDVLPVETLRCDAQQLVEILESMQRAAAAPPQAPAKPVKKLSFIPDAPPPADDEAENTPAAEAGESEEPLALPWDGAERRRGPALRYSLSDFPLLPSGPSLWADVPTSVVHLDVLVGTMQNVLVVFETSSIRAVGVVCDGERYDALYIDPEGVKTGRVAWELMISQREGTVSAYELEPELARTLPVLWRNRVVHRDLDTAWINRTEFLAAQRGDDEDRALIVATPDTIGIGLFAQGEAVAIYSTDSRMPVTDTKELQRLLGGDGEGRVTVLERLADDVGEAYIGRTPDEAPLEEEEDLEEVAGAFSFQPIDSSFEAITAPEETAWTPEAPAEAPVETEAEVPGADTEAVGAPEALTAEPLADLPTGEEPAFEEPAAEEAPVASEAAAEEEQAAPASSHDSFADMTFETVPGDEAAPETSGEESSDEETAADDRPETAQSAGEEAAAPDPILLPLTAPPPPPEPAVSHSMHFAPEGANVGLADFAGLLGGGASAPRPAPPPTVASEPAIRATRRLEDVEPQHPAVSDEPPPPPDFPAIIAELADIGTRFLGPDFTVVAPLLEEAPHTPGGLREAISSMRKTEIPNQSPETVKSMARAMVLYVADRVSAV